MLLELAADRESLVGFKLFNRREGDPLSQAVAVSLPATPPERTRGG